MYHALIIDDEKHVRQAVSYLGMWQKNSINPPYEAADGESALVLMEQYDIHIVLVDIKMPVMDGMQFLELATKRFPKAKYIIISGFNDFEYAKKAIGFRILDYLLKPVSEEELNHCLKKAVNELNNRQKLLAENPLGDLISSLCCDENSSDYLCSIASIRTAEAFPAWNPEAIKTFSSFLSEYPDARVKYTIQSENPYVLLLGITVNRAACQQIIHDISQSAVRFAYSTSIVTLIGIGSFLPPSASALKDSYREAAFISARMNLFSKTPIVSSEYMQFENYKPSSLSAKRALITRTLEKNDKSYFVQTLEQYFDVLQKKNLLTAETILHNSMELLLIFQDFAGEACKSCYYDALPSLTDMKQLKNINRISEYISAFSTLFDELVHLKNDHGYQSIRKILLEIKNYIEENYVNDINLTLFSEKYHLTKEYLSKQFKEQYDYGIYEYVLTFRMRKACELLLSSQMKIQEISDYMGYTDTNYFSKAFKTYYGISPKEYRQSHGTSEH